MTKDVEERNKKRAYIRGELMTSAEVCEYVGITRQGLNRYAKNDRLKQVKNGIYMKDDIIKFSDAYRKAKENNEWLTHFE